MLRKRRHPSIYDHIRAHIPDDGPGLRDGGETLPDEGGGTMWAPGAQDGVLIYHWGGSADQDEVERLYEAILSAVRSPSGYDALEQAAREARIISLIDGLLGSVRDSSPDPEATYRLAYRLATESSHREPVKLGIALLGLFSADHHRDELMALGRHDEFTLFALVALANREGDPEPDLWELARNVRGWGRIHLVERLARTENPQIKDWILREGFRNAVMAEYLAATAANAGDLAGRLAGEPDDDLLIAAAELLDVLCAEGGPVEGMSAYPEGERACDLFLNHMATRAGDLRHYFALHTLQPYASEHWPHLADRCAEILRRPLWPELARQGLSAPGRAEFARATRACHLLGVPTLHAQLARLRDEPYDIGYWLHAVREADDGTIGEVIDLAMELLPLEEIATGPASEDGLGRAFRPHGCLDAFLPDLGKWPGRGWPIVAAGLASPVVRNRNMAIRTLAAWGREAWPPEADQAVRTALEREPDPEVADRLRRLSLGEAVEG